MLNTRSEKNNLLRKSTRGCSRRLRQINFFFRSINITYLAPFAFHTRMWKPTRTFFTALEKLRQRTSKAQRVKELRSPVWVFFVIASNAIHDYIYESVNCVGNTCAVLDLVVNTSALVLPLHVTRQWKHTTRKLIGFFPNFSLRMWFNLFLSSFAFHG